MRLRRKVPVHHTSDPLLLLRFYRNESRAFLAVNTCPDYLKKVESRLYEEQDRVPNYLHASTRPKLEHIVESELISAHAASLINSHDGGFVSLLDMSEDRMSDLARMYALFSRVPQTLDLLRGALFEHVYDAGRRLVDTAVEMPVDFLEGLLLLRSKYDAVVTLAFRGETAAQKRLKEAFEQFLNADARCASCLVIYVLYPRYSLWPVPPGEAAFECGCHTGGRAHASRL